MEPLHTRGYDLITELPLFTGVKTTLHKDRRSALGIQREPMNASDIVFDEDTLRTLDGKSFLLSDNGKTNRIMIFWTAQGIETVREKKAFFMDGTFKSSSSQFGQLYTIHVDLGSSHDETNIVPVLFAFLPNKTTSTYKEMIQMVLDKIPEWRPESVTIDFEAAMVSALRDMFPNVTILGCFFHFSQALWRKVQDVGLTTLYKDCEEVRTTNCAKMCCSCLFETPRFRGRLVICTLSGSSRSQSCLIFGLFR